MPALGGNYGRLPRCRTSGWTRSDPGSTRVGAIAPCDRPITVTAMEHSETYSLTQLAAFTGTGKAGLRAMIEAGTLAASRAESGRREWIVRREDALAAKLRMPADVETRGRMVIRKSGGADGIDGAMHELLAELLGPIELRLARIELQTDRVAAMANDLTRNQTGHSHAWDKFKKIGGRLLNGARKMPR